MSFDPGPECAPRPNATAALGSRKAGLFLKEWGMALTARIEDEEALLREGGELAGLLRTALEQGHRLASVSFIIECPADLHAGSKDLIRALLVRFGTHDALRKAAVSLELPSTEGLPTQRFSWRRDLGGFDAGRIIHDGLTDAEAAQELAELEKELADTNVMNAELLKLMEQLEEKSARLDALVARNQELGRKFAEREQRIAKGETPPDDNQLLAEATASNRESEALEKEVLRLSARIEEFS